MGEYLLIPKRVGLTKELKEWFKKWQPFYNDFGDKHTFKDIFGDLDFDGNIRFKIGVMNKRFYPAQAIKEIKLLGGLNE